MSEITPTTIRDGYSTIVIWEACTSNGLNSPVRPYLSVAVTVNRTIPIGVSCGTTHLATQNSRSGCVAVARYRIGMSTVLPATLRCTTSCADSSRFLVDGSATNIRKPTGSPRLNRFRRMQFSGWPGG